jgi:hypothetical protein
MNGTYALEFTSIRTQACDDFLFLGFLSLDFLAILSAILPASFHDSPHCSRRACYFQDFLYFKLSLKRVDALHRMIWHEHGIGR